jgi:cell division GTPase FtsZ
MVSRFPSSRQRESRCAGEFRMADAEIKRLLKQLGEAINETLSDSPKINDCIQSIRDSGYEVFLIIEAKIGFNRMDKSEEHSHSTALQHDEPVHLRITSEDAKFLKSLKIAVDKEV